MELIKIAPLTCFEANYDRLVSWDGMEINGVLFSQIFKITGERQMTLKLEQLERLGLIERADVAGYVMLRKAGIFVCLVTAEKAMRKYRGGMPSDELARLEEED